MREVREGSLEWVMAGTSQELAGKSGVKNILDKGDNPARWRKGKVVRGGEAELGRGGT